MSPSSPPLLLLVFLLLLPPPFLTTNENNNAKNSNKQNNNTRFVGGVNSDQETWVVSLFYNCGGDQKGFCAGSLLDPLTVLTAKSCFPNDGCEGFATAGNLYPYLGETSPVKQVESLTNEASLWILKKPFQSVRKFPIIPDNGQYAHAGYKLTIQSWGGIGDGRGASEERSMGRVTVLRDNECSNINSNMDRDKDAFLSADDLEICVGVADDVTQICPGDGDAGAPLFLTDIKLNYNLMAIIPGPYGPSPCNPLPQKAINVVSLKSQILSIRGKYGTYQAPGDIQPSIGDKISQEEIH